MKAEMVNRQTIVVVDDTPEILDLLSVVLADEGFEVICCDAANRAVDVIADASPALVIVDLTMDGVHSWALVDAFAANPRTRRTPFIVCSGAVQELRAAEDRIRELGGAVLAKPFDLDRLMQLVRGLIRGVERS
jgi:DNA-binding response OmpR family regulator